SGFGLACSCVFAQFAHHLHSLATGSQCFTHQDPGFLDLVVNKSPDVCRIYLPPDANTLLSVANHCLKSTGYINVIVCDKQKHLQYTTMEQAIVHCTKGISIWPQASNDEGGEP